MDGGTVDGEAVDGVTIAVPPVLDAAAKALYLELLARGGAFRPDELGEQHAAALERLRGTALVVELHGGYWGLADPRIAAARLRIEYRAAAADLLARADEPTRRLADLAAAYDRAPLTAPASSPITHVENFQQIQQRIENLAAEAEREVLTMQPGGARPADVVRHAKAAAQAHRDRGIEIRTIYQPGARTDRVTAEYAAFVGAIGGRVRILDEPFLRMMVIDRSVAVVTGYRDNRVASFIEDPVLVGLVVDQFERDWARAERVRWDAPAEPDPLVRLLAQGLTQRAIAKRLRLSERTVAAQMARLRDEYDADTLFQLGWLARGVS